MKLSKLLVMTGSVLTAFSLSITAYAGEINGNEQSVMGVVQGSFEYDGVTYTAAPGYIEKARSYMAGDGVDLTAAQADEVIANIYANVKTGITEGYIIPVKDKAPAAVTEGETGQTDTARDKREDSKKDGKAAAEQDAGEEEEIKDKSEEKKTEPVVIIHTSSGTMEAMNAGGKAVFVAESVIKDTGYHLNGIVWLFSAMAMGMGICVIYIYKNKLLAHYDEP